MKKGFLIFLFYLLTETAFSQSSIDSVKVEDFKIPSTPGFALLDLSPTSIQKPSNPKAFAFSLLNFAGNGGALPKDFAMEVTPYWFFNLKKETFYKYSSVFDGEKHNAFSGILRKMSFSLSTHFNDSAKSFLPNTNYVSFGVRTNLVTVWGKKSNTQMKEYLIRYKNVAREVAQINNLSPEKRADTLEKLYNKRLVDIKKFVDLKPAFQLDMAFATANMYHENSYSNKRFFKRAVWVNATFNIPVGRAEYIYLIAYGRAGNENILVDTALKSFNKSSNIDFGTKLEYEKSRFSISAEHVVRKYQNRSDLNGSRTVMVAQYKIDDNLILYCTYGKNFPEVNNLFTLFGINWSFGSNLLKVKPD